MLKLYVVLFSVFMVLTCNISATPFIAGIIKITPKENVSKYSELRCTDDDKAKIREIIETLAKHSYYDLFANYRSRLEKIGDDVRPVHPLRFLGHICSAADTKECMRAILNDPIIKYNFMSNYGPRMDVELQKGTLLKLYEEFAQSINVSPTSVKSYIDNKNWEGLIRFLIND